MKEQMELTIRYEGKQILIHNGKMLNRNRRMNRINNILTKEMLSPCPVKVVIFYYAYDNHNRIYGGEMLEKDMYWNGFYCKNRRRVRR